MRRQNAVRYMLLGGVVLAAVACGSYDHKEQYSKVQQNLECFGSGDCTFAEEGNPCIYHPPGNLPALNLVCSSCLMVIPSMAGKFETPGCRPDAGASGAAGSAGTSTGGAPTGGAGGTTQTCVPGQQISCGCGNYNGTQVCNAQGVYGLCDCDAGAGGTSTGGTGGTATGGSAGAAGALTGGSGGVAGTGGTSTGGTAGQAGLAGNAGTSTGGAAGSGTGGATTGGNAGTAGSAGSGNCNISNLPLSCTTVVGTACPNKFEDAPNCGGLLRCDCTNMWSLTCAQASFTCSCHAGEQCSTYGWGEGYECTELDPGGDGGTRTLTCECNVMLSKPVVCVNPPDGGASGAGGSSVGGSGGSTTGGSAGTAGSAGTSTGGTGGTSAGGTAGSAGLAGAAGSATGGSGGALPDASTLLCCGSLLTDKCENSEIATSPATLPVANSEWLEYNPGFNNFPGTLVGLYDWITDPTTPGINPTDFAIRTVAHNPTTLSVFALLNTTASYKRYFFPKVIDPATKTNCKYWNNDGYYCNSTTDASKKDTLYCVGTWSLWNNNVKVATYVDAAGVTPTLPFIKITTLEDGYWAAKIGVHVPLSP